MVTTFFPDSERNEFRREIERVEPVFREAFEALPEPAREALLDTAIIGATVAMFAAPGAALGPMASKCEVASRRLLLRLMRTICRKGSGFRAEAMAAGGEIAESAIRRHLATFARQVCLAGH